MLATDMVAKDPTLFRYLRMKRYESGVQSTNVVLWPTSAALL
jgi:hypothetical protein